MMVAAVSPCLRVVSTLVLVLALVAARSTVATMLAVSQSQTTVPPCTPQLTVVLEGSVPATVRVTTKAEVRATVTVSAVCRGRMPA